VAKTEVSIVKIGQSLRLKNLARSEAIEVFKSFDEMGLIVVGVVEEKFVAFQVLQGGLGLQDVLETDYLAKGFGTVADVLLKQTPQVARADSNVEVFFNAQYARFLQDEV